MATPADIVVPGTGGPVLAAAGCSLAEDPDVRAIVLVEGRSDQLAIETLATMRGRDLEAEGVRVVPMGGARSIRKFVELFGPRGRGLRLAGLCDEREECQFRSGLERGGRNRRTAT